MRIFFKIIIIIIAILVLLMIVTQFVLVPYFLKKADMYDNIKQTHDKKYYYYVQSDSLSREALFIEDLEDKDSLIDYYNKTEKGINPYINFKCYPVPIDTIVFIMNYETKDSLIAKVLFHYKIEYGDENNKVAYVYTKLLHDKKYKCHQDSIVKKEQ